MNGYKSSSFYLKIFIEKLAHIHKSLGPEYQNETILRQKLLNEVKVIKYCKLAYHEPLDTVQGMISDLHARLGTAKRSIDPSGKAIDSAAHFLDCIIVQHSLQKDSGISCFKKCFVCNGSRCWSTNHPSKERPQTYRKKKGLRQFISLLASTADGSEDDTEQIEYAVEDIVTFFNPIGTNEDGIESHMKGSGEVEKPFLHLVSL